MISKVYAEVLKEIKKLGGKLTFEQEIALRETELNLGTTLTGVELWKKKNNPLQLI